MAGCEGSVVDLSDGPVSPTDFSGFESEHSFKDEEHSVSPSKKETKSGISEFIRNLPGLPANNPALFSVTLEHNSKQVVSCIATASGPLEDNSKGLIVDSRDVPTEKSKIDAETSNHEDMRSSAKSENEVKSTEKVLSSSRDKSSKDKSRHRSSRECKKCYERRKVKRCNVGVQCRIEKHAIKSTNHHYSLSRPLNSSNCTPNWEIHKYASLMSVEVYPNGGGSVVHMHQEEVDKLNLNERDLRDLADEFFKVISSDSYLIYLHKSYLHKPLCIYTGYI